MHHVYRILILISILPFTRSVSGQLHVLDFEGLAPGTVLTNLESNRGYTGIEVTGEHPSCPDQNAAVIFDSDCSEGCTGFDDDLGSPNHTFGGPGVGDGGEAGNTYANERSLGNILILHQYCEDLGQGISSVVAPQDYFGASLITLTFPDDVIIHSLTGIDIEAGETLTLHFYNAKQELILSTEAPETGDNGVVTFAPNNQEVHGVRKMTIEREGSGGIDEIVFNGDRADLRLSKYVNNASPDSLDFVVFLVTVVNDGPDDATNVEITDYLPDEIDYLFSEATGGITTYRGGSLIWDIPEFVVNDSFAVEIGVRVNTTLPLENTAEVTASDQPDPDSTPGNGDPTEDDQDRVIVTPIRVANGIGTSKESVQEAGSMAFSLNQNYPNPFNPSTEISYHLTGPMPIQLVVYDALAREVVVLADGYHAAGSYRVQFSVDDHQPSGLYFYRLETPYGIAVKSMNLIK